MKRLSFLLFPLAVLLIGAGCAKGPTPERNDVSLNASSTAYDRLRVAQLQDGPAAIDVDAATGRRFESVLPPIFTDGNGAYTTPVQGERISVQIAVGGSLDEDEAAFRSIPSMESFQRLTLGEWRVITARDVNGDRFVARATHADPFGGDGMYHVIECVSVPKSKQGFWDGCRTMIENAHISQNLVP